MEKLLKNDKFMGMIALGTFVIVTLMAYGMWKTHKEVKQTKAVAQDAADNAEAAAINTSEG